MARTNRTARKSTGGRVPRGQLAPRNPPPQEEPLEMIPEEEPIYRKAVEFRTYGGEALKASGRLKGLLHKVGINTSPEYHVKRIPRPGRDEFRAEVTIYDGPHVVSKHAGPAFRSTCGAAVSDAAWEAMTALHITSAVVWQDRATATFLEGGVERRGTLQPQWSPTCPELMWSTVRT